LALDRHLRAADRITYGASFGTCAALICENPAGVRLLKPHVAAHSKNVRLLFILLLRRADGYAGGLWTDADLIGEQY
jgi:hypothetical protein